LLDSRSRFFRRTPFVTISPPVADLSEPATLARRLAALGYDLFVLAAVLFVFTFAVFLVRGTPGVPSGTRWFQLALLAVAALFFCGFWTHGGQTVGMRAWRIRLVRQEGGPVGWSRALLRFFAAWVSGVPLGLGYWWSLFDPRRRCWHDRLSRTVVVHERKNPPAASAPA
jgi:uncharacterized RDD family membrane protein YckC